jgi:DNA-binding MarR family transcriptional regulator
MRLVWALHHGLEKGSKRMEASLGVTGLQRLVIRIVGRFPGITAGQLARTLHIHPSTLTGVLRRLETRRLIARRRDPQDGRLAVFALTRRGRRLDERTSGTVESVVRKALADVPERQILAARDVLGVIADRLLAWSP